MWKWTTSAVAAALALGACASKPPAPNEEMARARASIEFAENAGARQHAPLAFSRAQEKLARAQEALRNEEHRRAQFLATEAEADAALAAARTRTVQAEEAKRALEASLDTLRHELKLPPAGPGPGPQP